MSQNFLKCTSLLHWTWPISLPDNIGRTATIAIQSHSHWKFSRISPILQQSFLIVRSFLNNYSYRGYLKSQSMETFSAISPHSHWKLSYTPSVSWQSYLIVTGNFRHKSSVSRQSYLSHWKLFHKSSISWQSYLIVTGCFFINHLYCGNLTSLSLEDLS